MVHGCRPVSYTHLDVYKRQVLDEQGTLCGLITRSSLVTTFSKQFDLEEGEQA